jgi:hypothetical protein
VQQEGGIKQIWNILAWFRGETIPKKHEMVASNNINTLRRKETVTQDFAQKMGATLRSNAYCVLLFLKIMNIT